MWLELGTVGFKRMSEGRASFQVHWESRNELLQTLDSVELISKEVRNE